MADTGLIARAVIIAVILGWSAYPMIFFFRRKPPPVEDCKRDQWSVIGIMMQGVAFAIVWSVRRPLFTPIVQVGFPLDIGLAVTTIILLIGSLWITWAAIRLLGKQWSLTARLVTEHLLITDGPYLIITASNIYGDARDADRGRSGSKLLGRIHCRSGGIC